jgi:hypothetical protein
MTSRSIWPLAFLLLLVDCNPDVAVVPYPCKHPDPGHLGPDGKPDACHFQDPNSPAAAVAAFFGAAGPPFCEALFACCTNTAFLQSFAGGTVDDCKAIWSGGEGLGNHTLISLKAALVDGESVFDRAKLDACVVHLQALAAGGAACVEPVPFYLFNTCMGAFQGQILPGDACTWGMSNVEDLSFAECKDGRCVDGKCVAFLKSGGLCPRLYHISDSPDRICNIVQGEVCMGDKQDGVCGPPLDLGGACYANDLYVCKSQTCVDLMCVPPIPDDSACLVY